MTLVLTLATQNAIYQSSDFRLSKSGAFSDSSFKTLQVGGPDYAGWTWSGVISYAGVGSVSATHTSQWLMEILRDKAHRLPLSDVIELVRSSWASFVAPARERQPHSFIIGAFSRGTPQIAMLSNTSQLDPRSEGGVAALSSTTSELAYSCVTPIPGTAYCLGSGAAYIRAEATELARVSRRLPDDRHGSNRIFESLAKITELASIRGAGDGSANVSEGCWCTSVNRAGLSAGRTFGVSGAPYFPPALRHPHPDSRTTQQSVLLLQQKLKAEAEAREIANEERRLRSIDDEMRSRERELVSQSRQNLRPIVTDRRPAYAVIANCQDHDLSIIDVASLHALERIPVGSNPTAVCTDKLRRRAYVSTNVKQPHEGYGSIASIDLDIGTVAATIDVGIAPSSLDLTADCRLLYVGNMFSNDVSVVDLDSFKVIGWIAVGVFVGGLAVDSRANNVYIVDSQAHQLVVVDALSHAVKRRIRVGKSPNNVVLDEAGRRAFVANRGSNSVSIINLDNEEPIVTVEVRRSPRGLALAHDLLYVTCMDSNSVSLVNIATNRHVGEISVGESPRAINIDGTGALAYVINTGSDSVSIVDLSRKAVVNVINVGHNPMGIGKFLL